MALIAAWEVSRRVGHPRTAPRSSATPSRIRTPAHTPRGATHSRRRTAAFARVRTGASAPERKPRPSFRAVAAATGTDSATSTVRALQVRPDAFSTGSITAPPTPHPRAQIVTIFGTDERSMLCRLRSDQSSCGKPARWPSRRTDKQRNWNAKTIPLCLHPPPAPHASSSSSRIPFRDVSEASRTRQSDGVPASHTRMAAAAAAAAAERRLTLSGPGSDLIMVGDRMRAWTLIQTPSIHRSL